MVAFLPLFIAAQALLGASARAETLLTTVEEIVASALQVVSVSGLLDFIGSIPLGTKPANQAEAVEAIGKALNESGGSPLAFAGLLKSAGAFPGDDTLTLNDVVEQISGCGEPCSANNSNTREPNPSVYAPVEGDAPWHLSEADLRKALYFPPDYTFGKVKPLLMVPGTGGYGSQNYVANFGKKLQGSDVADPVYLNVPNYLLDDAQSNGEYVAYAIKYVSAISGGRQIGVITLSQGSVDTHWGLKYWPSARDHASDVINLSGDYKGADITNVICLLPVCQDAMWQQQTGSDFIETLRSEGGTSAYVPTTSIMSLTDEIVNQVGGEAASAYLKDERGVGVTNAWIQEACALQPGGGVYDHVGILFSNFAYELALDALAHDGPGKVERLDLATVCSEVAIPGLSVVDIIESQITLVLAFWNIFSYPATTGEPPIRAYAQ